MNRTYKLVWNAVQQAWVVASELGKSRKKSKAGSLLLAVAALGVVQVALAAPASRAIPVLDNIASGTAWVTSGLNPDTNRTNLTVSQTSDKLIANWTGFDVGQFSEVIFKQNSASNITLNRINSGSPSQIFGQVKSQIDTPTGPISAGQLIMVNPAGIVFGSSARVNAGSVIASTLDITDANFNAGVLQFDRGTSTGAIDIQKQGDNQGIIMAENGNTFVFAPTVTNSGTVRALAGNVTIANGNRLTVDASAGTATLNQVSGIAGLIQSTGVIRGDRLTTTDKGKVFIVGDRARTGSVVNLAGEITSTGNDVKGKTINITGNLIVNANTNFNAVNSMSINSALTIYGNNRLLSLAYGDSLNYGDSGRINIPDGTVNTALRDNGIYFYTVIRNLAALQGVAMDGRYILGADLDMTNVAFSPIGTSANPFTGAINGAGYKISNLTINKPNDTGVGLFGYVKSIDSNNKAVIAAMKLQNVNITGRDNVGGLIGQSGTYNETTKITGNGSVLFNNSISGSVNGVSNVGGLVGANYSSPISYSNANAVVTSSGDNVGGLVGNNKDSVVDNSYATGSVSGGRNVGGLIGVNFNSDVIKSYATGQVSAYSFAGGLIGENQYSDITRSHASGNVIFRSTGGGVFGGLIGRNSFSSLTYSYASGKVEGVGYLGGLIGVYNVDLTGSAVNQLNIIDGAYTAVFDNNYALGYVVGSGSEVGGLIGVVRINSYVPIDYLEPTVRAILKVTNSYSKGDVQGSGNQLGGIIGIVYNPHGDFYVNDTYSSGKISRVGDYNITAGVVGEVDNELLSKSYYAKNYWDSSLNNYSDVNRYGSNHYIVAPSTGLTTSQSKQLSSYSGWDISNQLTGSNSIWYINEGVSTPVLRALMTP